MEKYYHNNMLIIFYVGCLFMFGLWGFTGKHIAAAIYFIAMIITYIGAGMIITVKTTSKQGSYNECLQETIASVIANTRDEEWIRQGIMTVGELIVHMRHFCKDMPVEIDINGKRLKVGCFDSYRGCYSHLALSPGDNDVSVREMLEMVQLATRSTYTGYKGGEYEMSKITPIWIAEYGEASGVGLVDAKVKLEDGIVLLIGRNFKEE